MFSKKIMKATNKVLLSPCTARLTNKLLSRAFSSKIPKPQPQNQPHSLTVSPTLNFFWGDKDNKGSGKNNKFKGLFNFDPDNFNDPKFWQKVVLFFGVFGLVFHKQIQDYFNLYPLMTYDELKSSVRNHYIEYIDLKQIVLSKEDYCVAVVHMKSGQIKKFSVSNKDVFLEKLKVLQNPNRKNAQNRTETEEEDYTEESHIPIKTSYKRATDIYLQLGLNFIEFSAFAALFAMLLFGARAGAGGGLGGGGNPLGASFTPAKVNVVKDIKVKFKDVAGLDQAKLEIQEFVEFLKTPEKFKKLGAQIPRGALLSGPPGTGKTLLAKACAGEAGVSFFYASGSEFVEMFVGMGASRIRKLFKEAKENSPAIIFIDEIDAVGKKRQNSISSGDDERDATLNQLLVELDGFGTDEDVVVFAATNRKELLDDALTRTGRFDRSIEVQNPDLEGRRQIFMVHLAPIVIDNSRSVEQTAKRLATLTPGFSGSDIASICNEAAILAARKDREGVKPIDFEMAVERVIGGMEVIKTVSQEEREIVAVHESGHAVVSWFLAGGDPLLKLTIIPRSKGSLGFAQYLPNETSLEREDHIYDKICKILGGRVAEEEFFGRITTGAYDDLNKAFQYARAQVSQLGMSKKIGNINFSENDLRMKMYSNETNNVITQLFNP